MGYSPGGRYVVAGYADGFVRVFDWSTGKEIRSRKAHAGGIVRFVGFLADGERVVSAGSDKAVSLMNVGTGAEVNRITDTADLNSAALSADGATLLVHWGDTSKSDLRFYDPGSGRELHRLAPDQVEVIVVTAVALSPRGDAAILRDTDDVILVESRSGTVIHRLSPPGQVLSVACSTDGRRVIAGTGAEKPRLEEMDRDWDSLYAELLKRPLAHKVHVWDVASGEELFRCDGHTDAVTAVAISPDGRVALSAGFDGSPRVWQLA
jgi:WD40 repeat protein